MDRDAPPQCKPGLTQILIVILFLNLILVLTLILNLTLTVILKLNPDPDSDPDLDPKPDPDPYLTLTLFLKFTCSLRLMHTSIYREKHGKADHQPASAAKPRHPQPLVSHALCPSHTPGQQHPSL